MSVEENAVKVRCCLRGCGLRILVAIGTVGFALSPLAAIHAAEGEREALAYFDAHGSIVRDASGRPIEVELGSYDSDSKNDESDLNSSDLKDIKLFLDRCPTIRSASLILAIQDDRDLELLAKMPQVTSLTLYDAGRYLRIGEKQPQKLTAVGMKPLASLPHLESLAVNDMAIDDDAYPLLGQAHSLQTLSLYIVPISDKSLAALKDLKLQALSIECSDLLTGATLAALNHPTELRFLRLPCCKIVDTSLAAVRRMHNLEELDLHDNCLTDAGLASLAGLRHLKTLNLSNDTHELSYTRIAGPGLKHITGLDQIENLDLSGTGCSAEAIGSLDRLKQLTTLGVSNTKLDDAGLMKLARLPRLKKLSFLWTQVTRAGLRQVTRERPDVEVDYTPLAIVGLADQFSKDTWVEWDDQLRVTAFHVTYSTDDKQLAIVGQLSELKDLWIDEDFEPSHITATGLAPLTRLKKLRTLTCCIGDDRLEQIAKIAPLEKLVLTDCKSPITGLRHLQSLKNLKELEIWSKELTDDCLTPIGRMQSLRRLTLANDNNPIADAALRHLEGLHHLEFLRLDMSDVTIAGVAALRKKLPHCQVNGRRDDDEAQPIAPTRKKQLHCRVNGR